MTTVHGWFDCGVFVSELYCHHWWWGLCYRTVLPSLIVGSLLQNCIAITDGGVFVTELYCHHWWWGLCYRSVLPSLLVRSLLQNCIAITDEGSWILPIKGDVKCKECSGEECKFVIFLWRWKQWLMHFAFSTSCKEITVPSEYSLLEICSP